MNRENGEAALAEFARTFAEGGCPDFSKANLGVWLRCADALIDRGEMELGIFAVRQIHATWPESPWARNVLGMLDRMPPPDPDAPPFGDAFPSPVQLAPRAGAQTAMVVFCGADHGIGMPLAMLHRWLSQWPLSLIYLRDSRTLGYLGGIEELGQDLVSTLSVLRSRIHKLGARRIICYGASIGGYGALRYGLELGAETVICMSAMVNMRPEFNVGLQYRDLAERLQASFPDAELDLRQIYLSAERPPKTWMIYGEQNQDDRIHADHMAGIAGAVRVQVRGYRSHNPAAHLIRVGHFQELLRQTMGS